MRKRTVCFAGVLLAAMLGISAFSGCGSKAPVSQEEGGTPQGEKAENNQKEAGAEGNQEGEKAGNSQEEQENKDTQGSSGETEELEGQESSEEAGNTEEEEDSSKAILTSFQATTLSGGTFTEADLAEVDMTVINFWATSCGPCISEMPDLARFSKDLPERVQVVTVCLDGSGAEDEVAEILEEADFDGVTLLYGDGDFEALCYAVMYTPTTIFVDSDGNLAGDVIVGGKQEFEAVYTEALNKALAESGKEEVTLDAE